MCLYIYIYIYKRKEKVGALSLSIRLCEEVFHRTKDVFLLKHGFNNWRGRDTKRDLIKQHVVLGFVVCMWGST
jgi:hypothetical protein